MKITHNGETKYVSEGWLYTLDQIASHILEEICEQLIYGDEEPGIDQNSWLKQTRESTVPKKLLEEFKAKFLTEALCEWFVDMTMEVYQDANTTEEGILDNIAEEIEDYSEYKAYKEFTLNWLKTNCA